MNRKITVGSIIMQASRVAAIESEKYRINRTEAKAMSPAAPMLATCDHALRVAWRAVGITLACQPPRAATNRLMKIEPANISTPKSRKSV